MMRIGAQLAFCLACSISSVQAADLITVPTSTSAEVPITSQASFDWSGFYAGIHGGLGVAQDTTQYALGVQAGVNAQFDFYLVGAEIAVEGLAADGDVGSTSYGQILGRAGLVVSDDVMVYAAGGYGIDLGAPDESDILAGAGVELAVTDTITVDARYLHGFSLEGSDETDQVTLGANFHF